MATITFPLLTVVDDSGTVVSGATVAITSVTDKAGSAISSPGATVNQSGANVSVDYDPELKGEAWIVLAISKVSSTFTGLNAAPAFYLARDSSRVLTALPAAAPNANGGLPVLSSSGTTLGYTVTTVTTTTTATNLTNAPTTGDFTAAMKTSLNAATPASVVGAVGSVTGSVGSVVGNTAQTGDLYAKVNPLIASGAFTAPALALAPAGSGGGSVTVAGYASGQDPATLTWAASTRSLTDKAGFSLGSTGLDLLSVADPGAPAGHTTLPKMIVALYRRFYKKVAKTPTAITLYADNGTSANATQAVSDDGAGNQSVGAAS